MTAQAHHKIKVQVDPTPPILVTGDVTCALYGRKSHREYAISMTDSEGNELLPMVQFRFSELHQRFAGTFPPTFPSRGWIWEDYSSDEAKVRLRTDELKSYFHSLVNQHPLHLGSVGLAFGVEPSSCPALQAIVQRQLDEQKAAKEADQEQRRLKILKKQELERQVQEAKKAAHEATQKRRRLQIQKQREQDRQAWERVESLDVRQPATRELRCPSNRSFVFSSRFFSFGSADIYGGQDSNQVWFRLERTDLTMIPFADLTYYLTTARGVRLLKMVERFRMTDYVCDLFYVTGRDTTAFAGRVHRPFQFALAGEQYYITCPGGEQVSCNGGWLSCSLKVNGKPAATVHQHFVSFTNSHTVSIRAGQDCLLMVGICCAIGRIHAEIARRK